MPAVIVSSPYDGISTFNRVNHAINHAKSHPCDNDYIPSTIEIHGDFILAIGDYGPPKYPTGSSVAPGWTRVSSRICIHNEWEKHGIQKRKKRLQRRIQERIKERGQQRFDSNKALYLDKKYGTNSMGPQ